MPNFKNIRVCQVLHGIVGGGSEQVVLNYCSRMRDIHFDLLYQYEPNPQILERFNEAEINCIQIPDKVHHPLKHLWTMYKIFRQGKYDVVHCHLDWYMNSYVCILAMLAGVKKRIAHHHQAYHPDNLFLKLLCTLLRIPCKLSATHWFACGQTAAINGWGRETVQKGNVTILPNAIDPERFKFNEMARQRIRAQYGIAEDDFIIGHVGRFFPEKNHKFIICLFEEFVRNRPDARLILIGNGPLQQDVQASVKKMGLENRVIFAGLQKDVVPYYCAMDVLLLPSVREAFPMTLVEAQYNGLPCVVSDAVPKETAITEAVCSLPINDVGCWVEKLSLFGVGRSCETVSVKSDRFNINQCYKTLESLYQTP